MLMAMGTETGTERLRMTPGFQLQHLDDYGSIHQDEKLGKGKRVDKRNKQDT